MSIFSGMVSMRHEPQHHDDMGGYDLELVCQAMRNVAPGILVDPRKLTHLHPAIVAKVKEEYNRLLEAKK